LLCTRETLPLTRSTSSPPQCHVTGKSTCVRCCIFACIEWSNGLVLDQMHCFGDSAAQAEKLLNQCVGISCFLLSGSGTRVDNVFCRFPNLFIGITGSVTFIGTLFLAFVRVDLLLRSASASGCEERNSARPTAARDRRCVHYSLLQSLCALCSLTAVVASVSRAVDGPERRAQRLQSLSQRSDPRHRRVYRPGVVFSW